SKKSHVGEFHVTAAASPTAVLGVLGTLQKRSYIYVALIAFALIFISVLGRKHFSASLRILSSLETRALRNTQWLDNFELSMQSTERREQDLPWRWRYFIKDRHLHVFFGGTEEEQASGVLMRLHSSTGHVECVGRGENIYAYLIEPCEDSYRASHLPLAQVSHFSLKENASLVFFVGEGLRPGTSWGRHIASRGEFASTAEDLSKAVLQTVRSSSGFQAKAAVLAVHRRGPERRALLASESGEVIYQSVL
ncbi:MAG: hypothetical protein AAGB31_11470, partial [Bdellovibrio sp.]